MERKVWIKVSRDILYANLYILLVGGPGVGKTMALRKVTHFWNALPDLHVAPDSVSRASLADEMMGASRSLLDPLSGAFEKFNSLQVCVEEFGTFLSQYESEFMSTLNKLYDCTRYKEKKRSMKDAIIIEKPHLNITAATTPAWLSSSLPDSAWAEGFSSRLLLVFSAERTPIDFWGERTTDGVLEEKLAHDLQAIHTMHGFFRFDAAVQEALQAWADLGCPPIPEHPKLEHYIPRRPFHLLKLCMVMSAARSSELVIRMEDYQAAMDLFLETEALMPEVFKSMKYNSDSNVIDEVYNFVWQFYSKTGKGMPQHLINRFIAERAPSYAVDKILHVMINSRNIIATDLAGEGGQPLWKPAPKASF